MSSNASLRHGKNRDTDGFRRYIFNLGRGLVQRETQAKPERGFTHRMFRYFARLALKHSLPIYPIALFSFEHPRRRQPARLDVELPGLHVLGFRFRAVQLNRMDWRAFLARPNPVAAALMARMRIAPVDRPRAKLECLRLLATLRLDPARTRLVSGFVDSYLRLTGHEQRLFEAEVRQVPEEERGKVMELTTSWKEEGLAQGREEGRKEGRKEATLQLVRRLLVRRLDDLPEEVDSRIRTLSQSDLETLAEALLDFQNVQDLERWLSNHGTD